MMVVCLEIRLVEKLVHDLGIPREKELGKLKGIERVLWLAIVKGSRLENQ